ncbi:hypothetical protein TanjilG_32356 [Lupinus angustifolius]|uniref:Uncharacterized protein n=1 Tax=Lupinus angustifolius TaxID=3871 RepID=A0A4P1R0F4_LUPAN|nr:hypothetical protein TanjilG_32356 [Lupinus angustifolius]
MSTLQGFLGYDVLSKPPPRMVHYGSASLRWVTVVPNRSDDLGSLMVEPEPIKAYQRPTPCRLSRGISP